MRLHDGVICALLVACGGGERVETTVAREVREASAEPSGPPDLTQGEDITAELRAKQSDRFRGPPSIFRHIETTVVDAPTPERTELGYRVQLPSGAPVMTPTVYGDKVVVSGGFRSRTMYAFNTHTGQPAWAIGLGDDGPSNAACEDDVCVFNTESCTIFGVDANDGRLLWSWYLGDPLMSAPAIANGVVYAAYPATGGGTYPPGEDRPIPDEMSHALGAFDLRTGELKWTRWLDAEVISAPVAWMGKVYATTFAGTVVRFDQETGELEQARQANATSAPAMIDGYVVVSRRFEEGTGEQMETRENLLMMKGSGKPGGGESESRPAPYLNREFQESTSYDFESADLDAANGFAGGAPAAANMRRAQMLVGRTTVHGLQEYQGSWVLGVGRRNIALMGSALVGFDRASGREMWAVPMPGDLTQIGGTLASAPASAGNRVVLGTVSGELLIVDPDRGEVDRRMTVGSPVRTQPAVHEGWVYVGTTNGQLVAVNTGNQRLTGWTTWAGNAARTGQPE